MIYQCQSQIYINKHGVWSHCNIGHCITYIGKYIFTSSDFFVFFLSKYLYTLLFIFGKNYYQ